MFPILENSVDEFERVANNEGQLNLISTYRQLSASLDLINIVSDQLVQEWEKNRPDIVIADFITLSGGLVAEQLGIPLDNNQWRHSLLLKRQMDRLVSLEEWAVQRILSNLLSNG